MRKQNQIPINNFLKIIVPAAGYGTRMGSLPAKELLPHPQTGQPLLWEAINRHQSLQAPFHIISRKDKVELNHYIQSLSLKNNDFSLELQLIEPSLEWPDSVLKSQPYWSDWNLLLLPDADYAPLLNLTKLEPYINCSPRKDVVFFTFPVQDGSTWGLIQTSPQPLFFEIVEKPLTSNSDKNALETFSAWGLILFHKNIGEKLFKALLESSNDHFWKRLEGRVCEESLFYFTDLTRSLNHSVTEKPLIATMNQYSDKK